VGVARAFPMDFIRIRYLIRLYFQSKDDRFIADVLLFHLYLPVGLCKKYIPYPKAPHRVLEGPFIRPHSLRITIPITHVCTCDT
jgi:hypothetical protein